MHSRLTTKSLKIEKKVRFKSYEEIIKSGYWKLGVSGTALVATNRLLNNYVCDIFITKSMIEDWLGKTAVVRRIDDIDHFRIYDSNCQFHITMVDLVTKYNIE